LRCARALSLTLSSEQRAELQFVARSVYYYTDSAEFGGAEAAMLRLIEDLDTSRWAPTLLFDDARGAAPLAARAEKLGVPVHGVPSMPLGLVGARRTPRFARMLRRASPDVFHAHLSWPLAAKYPLAAAVLARVPAVVATVHLFPPVRIDRSNVIQQRLLAGRVGRYIAVSQGVACQLATVLGWSPENIDVIRNGITVERVRRQPDPRLHRCLAGDSEQLVFLTVARLAPQKGLDVLLRACPAVDRVRFVVAGEGPERVRLESQAAELGIRDRVLFLGYRTDVPELLAASDAFVLPSLYEGTSLALLEAMAAGKAVVASAASGTDELVVHAQSGLLCPPGNVEALVHALRRIRDDPEARARLGAAATQRAAVHFSAAETTRRVTGVYDDLLGKRGGS
jgi:glycosyltransferase involved in cell wall biosynthesis